MLASPLSSSCSQLSWTQPTYFLYQPAYIQLSSSVHVNHAFVEFLYCLPDNQSVDECQIMSSLCLEEVASKFKLNLQKAGQACVAAGTMVDDHV